MSLAARRSKRARRARILRAGKQNPRAIAERLPKTHQELLSVSGIGSAKAEKFGEKICRIWAPADDYSAPALL